MIINIFVGSGTEKKAGSGEVRCVAGTVPQSGVRRHFINPFTGRSTEQF